MDWTRGMVTRIYIFSYPQTILISFRCTLNSPKQAPDIRLQIQAVHSHRQATPPKKTTRFVGAVVWTPHHIHHHSNLDRKAILRDTLFVLCQFRCIRNCDAQPGGRVLASTTSSASFSISSFGAFNGVRGIAVRPVLDDSNIPNGAINAMKESIRAGLAEL